ncbi:hypothetical protein HZS61_004627 [Fusarium oxysporum f. sp. conglutinans]|uniref:Homeobox domain-containing protein n=1 Tax=Fusarium oxysporum f. sp. conglutinans TaxID=100902 RepID=A0A8H6GE78_FUSOX|nr:hypothetical protein HZS61_004627 [Fusarium oxysporum f. sp. conglutinans]
MEDSLPNRSGGSSTPPPDMEPKTPIRTVRVPQIQALPQGVPPPPTALETEDYYGLWRNTPRLIARSNYPDDQWSGLCNNWSQVEDSHPLKVLCSDPEGILQKELTGALEYTQWNCFETYRIGSALQENQVKLLIIVEAGSTSRLTDAGYFRVTFFTGSLAHVVGIFTASFGSELWIMFVTLGLGVGLGNGLMSCPMLAVMSQYFTKRRGMAFVTLAFANICLRPRTSAKSISGWVDWTAFRDVRFNHYAIATFMSLLGLYISIFFIVDFSRTSISPSLSYRNGLSLLMIFNGVNAIGRFGSGLAADKFGVLGVFVPVLVATSLTLFTWISVRTVPSILGPGDSPEVNSIPPFGPTETLAPIASNVRAEVSTISNPPPKIGKRLSLNSVRILNKWLSNHTHHPYPSVRDVEAIERQTGLARQQILNWFANARRRKKFNPPETTDPSSAEASPRDMPLRRPPTPTVQQSPLERWENSPPEDEPSTMAAIARAVSGASGSIDQPHDPDNGHFEEHNHDLCHKRERGERVFYRKDHLRQHLRLVHGSEFMKWPMEEWKSKHEGVMSRCGFCDIAMTTWSERVNHLAEHFKEGRTMADWKGNWGFDAATLDMVENHMPPYLIDYERNSPLPFSTQQGAPYSSTSAFELLQLELDYFYANYTDINHSIPSDETLHFEACCIIFGAEMNYQHPSTATSWLRDLIMGTQDIVNKARMTPMKSAARSRFSELKIHSKKDIFEDCKLETSLRQYVDMLQLLNLEIGDVELQKEACSIINHMPDASPMFSQLLIGLVYGSTSWLASFRERVGLPPSEVVSSNTQEGLVPPLLSSGGLPAISSNDHKHWRPPSGSNSPPISLGQKIVSLNDGNMYRGLTRDLTRYVARTISPLNPTSHIPTDEELQYQARWIMYDSHDVWNQTPADNLDWLTEFKRDSGFF